jgi:hypothetical protein
MGGRESKLQEYSVYDNIQNCSSFEGLSNELIYELFDYLSYHDICHSFWNINQRFQNLIDTHSHYVNLKQCNCRYPLPRRIRALKISARYQFSLIDFSDIISLHCLILSNLSTSHLLHICNTVSLKELEYVYLSSGDDYHGFDEQQLAEIQEKILLLGELKLTKCVFRTKLCVDINQLSLQLSSLEYLRIDGCENILIINSLLERMPNLSFLRVSILDRVKMNNINNRYATKNIKNNSLTNLNIRIRNLESPEELISLFSHHCSNLKTLIISLNPIRHSSLAYRNHYARFVDQNQWITNIINPYLPQLINFHLRQRVLSDNYDLWNLPCYLAPYVEDIPTLFKHRSYRRFIAAHLTTLWQQTA